MMTCMQSPQMMMMCLQPPQMMALNRVPPPPLKIQQPSSRAAAQSVIRCTSQQMYTSSDVCHQMKIKSSDVIKVIRYIKRHRIYKSSDIYIRASHGLTAVHCGPTHFYTRERSVYSLFTASAFAIYTRRTDMIQVRVCLFIRCKNKNKNTSSKKNI